jgi:hypothetical protein
VRGWLSRGMIVCFRLVKAKSRGLFFMPLKLTNLKKN